MTSAYDALSIDEWDKLVQEASAMRLADKHAELKTYCIAITVIGESSVSSITLDALDIGDALSRAANLHAEKLNEGRFR